MVGGDVEGAEKGTAMLKEVLTEDRATSRARRIVRAYAIISWLLGLGLTVFFYDVLLGGQAMHWGNALGFSLIALVVLATTFFVGTGLWKAQGMFDSLALVMCVLLVPVCTFMVYALSMLWQEDAANGSFAMALVMVALAFLDLAFLLGMYLFGFNRDVKALFSRGTT